MSSSTTGATKDTQLPPWLARYTRLGFDAEDVSALIDSIDSSQDASAPSHLPSELLLQILEFVPVDYLLDWRLVCRGFKDAIDGRVLYHHLRRAEVIGYMGPRHSRPMELLEDEQYDKIHLLHARFDYMDEPRGGAKAKGQIWTRSHAVFRIDEAWFTAFREIGGAAARDGHTVEDADTIWLPALDRLELRRMEEGFGSLRWCLRLDHAVLDLDFPLERGRGAFDVHVDLHKQTVWIGWRAMMLRFLKTERVLRLKMEETEGSTYTFSHSEDCLRYIRRQRLHSALNPDNSIDRHLKWSLRLLKPLFGKAQPGSSIALSDVEDHATQVLLLLRREASMSTAQLAHLHKLSAEYTQLQQDMAVLDRAFAEFKRHLTMPEFDFSIPLRALHPFRVDRNPISWPDELRAEIEALLCKWRAQKQVIEQMQSLLAASNDALTVPENSFDDLGSDF